VLGALLQANEQWDEVSSRITSADFYQAEHQQIFRAMELLSNDKHPIDVVTLQDKLRNLNLLEKAGGLPYLAELAHNTPSAANIKAYAQVVLEKSQARKLLLAARQLEALTRNPEGRSIAGIMELTERELMEIAKANTRGSGPRDVDALLDETLDYLDALTKLDGKLSGISSGFTDLDKKTHGLQKSELIIVAARPAMGKTSFAMNLVEAALLLPEKPKPCVVFSMEMDATQLILRLVSSVARVDQGNMKRGTLTSEEGSRLTVAFGKLKKKPLYIDDTPAMSPAEIRSRVRKIARERGEIGLIMIDYLQLMQVPGKPESRTAEISEISRSLKALAKEFSCPVIALSQLNRSLEQRQNKQPLMSDLRESGAIEQDADLILFLYREEVYTPKTENRGQADVIIGKHRTGEQGTIRLAWLGKFTRFDNDPSGENRT
jgi:replicative DNA helicase